MFNSPLFGIDLGFMTTKGKRRRSWRDGRWSLGSVRGVCGSASRGCDHDGGTHADGGDVMAGEVSQILSLYDIKRLEGIVSQWNERCHKGKSCTSSYAK